jgi:signal transduction histidine kinase
MLTALTAWLARTIAQRRLQERLRRLEQAHALEKERARIARDLHDDLGSSLTEVGLLADRLVESAPGDLAPQLSGLAWRTRRLATDLSGIVWTMNASNSSLDRLAHFFQRYADRLFRNTGTRCVTTGIESIPAVLLAPDLQHNLLAIVKESMNNILKHARATEARLELSYAEGIFQIRVSDNGVGFVVDQVEHDGNGLRNMQVRVKEMKGTFKLTSVPGAGAAVLICVPDISKKQIL